MKNKKARTSYKLFEKGDIFFKIILKNKKDSKNCLENLNKYNLENICFIEILCYNTLKNIKLI